MSIASPVDPVDLSPVGLSPVDLFPSARSPSARPPSARPPSARPRTAVPVLLLVGDTGGGHRSAAAAVADALRTGYPDAYRPVVVDPLAHRRSGWLTRRAAGAYGPLIRRSPRLWGLLYRVSDSDSAVRALQRTALRGLHRAVTDAVDAIQPAAVVSFHPLVADAAARAARARLQPVPSVTVVTDLVTLHRAWFAPADRIVVPPAGQLRLPVGPAYQWGPPAAGERARLRARLGVADDGFLVVLMGGGEGSGGLGRRARALLRSEPDAQVAVLCGRNHRLQRRLAGHPASRDGRLVVRGFVDGVADWLRAADLVVTKAGPATLAEAAGCGTPMLLTGHLPGQEAGNAGVAVAAGAARWAPTVPGMVEQVGALRADPAALAGMRAAATRLADPGAAASVASLVHQLAGARP
ncbi:MAG TPA: glycosyltransferase [Acidimicrobiales bacterium]|nr:glycosyltransferase [Acidimicrobiales bacterium]